MVGGNTCLALAPEQTPRSVEHLQLYIHLAARAVVIDDELRRGGSRIAGALHAEAVGLQRAHHLEVELGHRRVVEHVPGTEGQRVLALRERGQAVAHRA